MEKEKYIANYLNKKLKNNKLPYCIQYLNLVADLEIIAEKKYNKFKKMENKITKMETKKVIDLKKGDVIETLFNLKEVKAVKKDEDDLNDTWITIFFTDGSKYHCLTDELISLFF
jgi:hypothetical protein